MSNFIERLDRLRLWRLWRRPIFTTRLYSDNFGSNFSAQSERRQRSQKGLGNHEEGIVKTSPVAEPLQDTVARPIDCQEILSLLDAKVGPRIEAIGVLLGRELVPN